MNTKSIIFASLFGAVLLTACDEGDIIEEDKTINTTSAVIKLSANISGIDTWSNQYSIVVAGFADNDNTAIVQNKIVSSPSDGFATFALNNEEITTVELCATNRLRQRVATFASVSVSQIDGDTLRLNAGDVDVNMYKTIQDNIFTTTCARCHGLGSKLAGGLTLAEGSSYAALVNQSSSVPERGIRVVPGDITNSLLHKVIHGDSESGVGFNHANMIKEDYHLTLIDNWIKNGAQQ